MSVIHNTTTEVIKASAMRRQGAKFVMHLNNIDAMPLVGF